jgi:hypothetical protein
MVALCACFFPLQALPLPFKKALLYRDLSLIHRSSFMTFPVRNPRSGAIDYRFSATNLHSFLILPVLLPFLCPLMGKPT